MSSVQSTKSIITSNNKTYLTVASFKYLLRLRFILWIVKLAFLVGSQMLVIHTALAAKNWLACPNVHNQWYATKSETTSICLAIHQSMGHSQCYTTAAPLAGQLPFTYGTIDYFISPRQDNGEPCYYVFEYKCNANAQWDDNLKQCVPTAIADLGEPSTCAGNPCDVGTGNKFHQETDITVGALTFDRYYNSHTLESTNLGQGWTASLLTRLEFVSAEAIVLWQNDGRGELFTRTTTSGTTPSGNYNDAWQSCVNTAHSQQQSYSPSVRVYWCGWYNGSGFARFYTTISTGVHTWLGTHKPTNYTCPQGKIFAQWWQRGLIGRVWSLYSVPNVPNTIGYHRPCVDRWDGRADSALTLDFNGGMHDLTLPDGRMQRFYTAGLLVAEHDAEYKNFTRQYSYDSSNQLTTATDQFGNTLSFTYNLQGLISQITTPLGQIYSYSYDGAQNLISVTYPDGAVKIYHYENLNYPNHLTGITDENGNRYATYDYDSEGKASRTEHAVTDNTLPQEQFSLLYSGDQTTVTDALGNSVVYNFNTQLDTKNLISKINQSDGKSITQSFDASNNLVSRTDEEGRQTTYTYNATNQRLTRTEAAGTPEARTTSYEYLSPDVDLVTKVIRPSVATGNNLETVTTYSGFNPSTITLNGYTPSGIATSRTTSFQYNTHDQVTQIDGPRTGVSDLTTLTYKDCTTGSQCGQLASVTNASGQTTTYSGYDTNGRVTQTTDANGLVTTYSYDYKGRVLSITQTPPIGQGGARVTTNSYDGVGQLLSVTTPDGITLTYSYDAAHDLRSIQDNLGNRIEYSYDLKGNRTQSLTKDPDATLVRSVDTAYDIRNRVNQINAAGSVTDLVNDAVGNLKTETDPNQNPSTTHAYDGLYRLQQTLDALGNPTQYNYDVGDRIVQVVAPNNSTTTYNYDDLGNLLQETSPDRGTLTYSHDSAGNVLGITDARGIATTYAYDALNRLTTVTYPNDIGIGYVYEGCTNGIGRLCILTDQTGTTTYEYDSFGNLTEQTQAISGNLYTTTYTYGAGNRITSITYPSGRVVNYVRDAIGRIVSTSTSFGGQNSQVTTNQQYRSDGLLTEQTFGNALQESRTYDLQGRLGSIIQTTNP